MLLGSFCRKLYILGYKHAICVQVALWLVNYGVIMSGEMVNFVCIQSAATTPPAKGFHVSYYFTKRIDLLGRVSIQGDHNRLMKYTLYKNLYRCR